MGVIKRFWGSTVGRLLVFIAAALIYFLIPQVKININQAFFILNNRDIHFATGYIQGFEMLAPLASFLLMVFQGVVAFLPSYIIIAANSKLFGLVIGVLLSWAASLAGSAVCFFITRYFLGDVLGRLTEKLGLKDADRSVGRYGFHMVLLTRLLPFVPFDLISYLSGITAIGFRQFIIATGIGQLPVILIYSITKGMLTGTVRNTYYILSVIFVSAILAVLFKSAGRGQIKSL